MEKFTVGHIELPRVNCKVKHPTACDVRHRNMEECGSSKALGDFIQQLLLDLFL